MSKTPTADEQPKKKVARRVIATKRLYFMPEQGVTIEARDAAEASKLLTKQHVNVEKEQEEGDA